MRAAFFGLQIFAKYLRDCEILLRIDNTTAIAYINKMGGQRKRKQHATILTATPMKMILEERKEKREKLDKTGKNDKSVPKKVIKDKKKKHIKQKSYKRNFLQESSSESEDEEHLCDDDSDDEMNVDDENYNKCIICEEFGKNELWYRCTICGLWAHAICSGWDSPNGYICDLCDQK
ncbi:unnamed protein product [Euphydryas editha]|uniref:Zinc finger PHD-type domain-containing protein n=1 Tax=Euphydryas editha TaxID=104508 RepID=A0AAU9UXF5_EUPED|nr:unnamed protein product [Euphydryas editha]